MFLYDFTKFLGWVVVIGFCFGLSNWLLKAVNKKWVSKWPADRKPLADAHRMLMRIVITAHKPAGLVTATALLAHFILMFTQIGLSVSGVIALACLLSLVCIGIYGARFAKVKRGKWLMIHRTLGFVLILAILVHLLLK